MIKHIVLYEQHQARHTNYMYDPDLNVLHSNLVFNLEICVLLYILV